MPFYAAAPAEMFNWQLRLADLIPVLAEFVAYRIFTMSIDTEGGRWPQPPALRYFAAKQ
jgi:hypothetical protein